MKCIILCAGYATRLYPLTINKPKPLLPVYGKPILNNILEKILKIKSINEIFIACNKKFYGKFVEWKKEYFRNAPVEIINDGTKTNESRLGGIGDLLFVIKKKKITDELLVICGDIFFDFDLEKFVNYFIKKKTNLIGLYNINSISKAKNFGVLKLENNCIISFEEKPEHPKSSLISAGIYAYTQDDLPMIKKYAEEGNTLEGPGYLIPYFMRFRDVHGYVLEGKWHDIGTKEEYNKVKNDYCNGY